MLGQTTEYNNNASNDANGLNASSSNVRLTEKSRIETEYSFNVHYIQ